MKEKNQFEKDVDFVARHYRRNGFPKHLPSGVAAILGRRSFVRRVAAAVASVCVITASAYFVGTSVFREETPQETTEIRLPKPEHPGKTAVRRIEFDNTPLSEVAGEVEKAYDVELIGVPADTTLRISISYEGTAADFVTTVNELLNTDIKIKE